MKGVSGLKAGHSKVIYFITDALSTVRDVVNSSGTVLASYEFDEYGRRLATSESGVSSQKTFVGGMSVQDEVADTGLMMMGHRFYEPELGRFLNRDPIGFAGGPNLFAYAKSSPVQFIDPEGLEPPMSVMDRRLNINQNPPKPRPVHVWTMEGAVPDDGLVIDVALLFVFPGGGRKGWITADLVVAEEIGLTRVYGPGKIVNLGAKGTPKEKAAAQFFADRGFYVETKFGSSNCGQALADIVLEGKYAIEVKHPTGINAARRAISEAVGSKTQVNRVFLDMSSQAIGPDEALEIMNRVGGQPWFTKLEGVWIHTRDADYLYKVFQ